MNTGYSTRLPYDGCAYEKHLQESVAPLDYRMYTGAYENSGRCVYNKLYRPFDLVNEESELLNITRRASKCTECKYSPGCERPAHCGGTCRNTFDKKNPVVLAPEVCPIVHNNIKKPTTTGYELNHKTMANYGPSRQ